MAEVTHRLDPASMQHELRILFKDTDAMGRPGDLLNSVRKDVHFQLVDHFVNRLIEELFPTIVEHLDAKAIANMVLIEIAKDTRDRVLQEEPSA